MSESKGRKGRKGQAAETPPAVLAAPQEQQEHAQQEQQPTSQGDSPTSDAPTVDIQDSTPATSDAPAPSATMRDVLAAEQRFGRLCASAAALNFELAARAHDYVVKYLSAQPGAAYRENAVKRLADVMIEHDAEAYFSAKPEETKARFAVKAQGLLHGHAVVTLIGDGRTYHPERKRVVWSVIRALFPLVERHPDDHEERWSVKDRDCLTDGRGILKLAAEGLKVQDVQVQVQEAVIRYYKRRLLAAEQTNTIAPTKDTARELRRAKDGLASAESTLCRMLGRKRPKEEETVEEEPTSESATTAEGPTADKPEQSLSVGEATQQQQEQQEQQQQEQQEQEQQEQEQQEEQQEEQQREDSPECRQPGPRHLLSAKDDRASVAGTPRDLAEMIVQLIREHPMPDDVMIDVIRLVAADPEFSTPLREVMESAHELLSSRYQNPAATDTRRDAQAALKSLQTASDDVEAA